MPTNKPLLQTLRGLTPSRYPIWFLRQAGRYLPEYMKIRKDLDFLALCRHPAKAAEVTLQPLRRYDLDAAIIFSDILVPLTALGQELTFDKGHGPRLHPGIRTDGDLSKLVDPSRIGSALDYVGDAIAETKIHLAPHQTMIGFAGAPFTVASYMIEGQGTKEYAEVKRMMFQSPRLFESILKILEEVTVNYLAMQVRAGAEALMVFDSWAGNLAPKDHERFVRPSNLRLFERLACLGVPLIYFPGQGSETLPHLEGVQCHAVHVDWRVRLAKAHSILSQFAPDMLLQGNLDPQSFLAPEESLRERVRWILDEVRACGVKGHIFNVGHGLLPTTPPESLTWAIEEVRKQRP